tara:strand:- start:9368 stop:9544 length:177 start_codon:yes stop_codon:yes gene_type:complete
MNDLYNKEDKAGKKQQLRSRLTLLNDELVRIREEEIDILADMVTLESELSTLKNSTTE